MAERSDLRSWCSLLPAQSVTGLVGDLLDLVPGHVDHSFDLVLRVVDLLLGLTCAPIRLAFGFEVLVPGKDTRGLLDVALNLIRLCAHRAPPSSSPDHDPDATGR